MLPHTGIGSHKVLDICSEIENSTASPADIRKLVQRKRKRTQRRRYLTRDVAGADVFDYIKRNYNRKRQHGYVENDSPAHFENRTSGLNTGVHETLARPNGQ